MDTIAMDTIAGIDQMSRILFKKNFIFEADALPRRGRLDFPGSSGAGHFRRGRLTIPGHFTSFFRSIVKVNAYLASFERER